MSGAISAGTVLGGVAAAGLGMQIVGSFQQSKATKAATAYQAGVSANNAQLAEWQAQDALQRGQTAEQQSRMRTAQLKGSQRARLAASGVALTEGSALNILDDTDYMGEQDALTVRNNAAKEAWAYRNQAAGLSTDALMLQSRADAESPGASAFGSFLTGAGQVASSWYQYKNARTTPAKVT